jgi:hypothetical protein
LKIVRSRISMLALWTEGTYVAWAVVHQTMANHFVLALEAFTTFRAWAAGDGTVVWPTLAVDVFVGAELVCQ